MHALGARRRSDTRTFREQIAVEIHNMVPHGNTGRVCGVAEALANVASDVNLIEPQTTTRGITALRQSVAIGAVSAIVDAPS